MLLYLKVSNSLHMLTSQYLYQYNLDKIHNNIILQVFLNYLQIVMKELNKSSVEKELQSILSQLQEMEITIGFHGVCNVGKSTLLNALLRK